MNTLVLVAGAALLLRRPALTPTVAVTTTDALPTCGGETPGTVAIYDPSGGPTEILWAPSPAPAPPGYHWERMGWPVQPGYHWGNTGWPAPPVDPVTGLPGPGVMMLLVRDGFTLPRSA
jgi:hypothetical protein